MAKCLLLWIVFWIPLLAALPAQGDSDYPSPDTVPAPSDAQRPPYQTLRYNENYLFLRTPQEKPDFFDPIKYIPLSPDGQTWLSFGGQVRERLEVWQGYNFGAPPGADPNDTFLLSRFLFHADLHLGTHVRLFGQAKSSFTTDRDLEGGNSNSYIDDLDLQNGFIDLSASLFGDRVQATLRLGRQEMLFGVQRVVSVSNWGNVRRTFDGGSLILNAGDWTATAFWTLVVPVQKYAFNTSENTQFFGIYATGKGPLPGLNMDFYWVGLNAPIDSFPGEHFGDYNGTTGNERRQTTGGRLWGDVPGVPIDYDLEGNYQFGTVGSGDVSAFMVSFELGYTFPKSWSAPRAFIAFDYASGDKAAGGNVQTYNLLFASGHEYLGWIDQIGRQNIVNITLGITLKPVKNLTVDIQGHFFWRAQSTDGLYGTSGSLNRAPGVGLSLEVGQEIDFLVKYKFTRHTEVYAGYSHFFPGPFIKQSGPSQSINFFYIAWTYTF